MQYDLPALQEYVADLYKDQIQNGKVRAIVLEPYAYNLPFAALDAVGGVSAPGQINIQANADFLCLDVSHRTQITGGGAQTVSTKVAPFVRMLVTDQGSGKQWTNSAIDLENYSTNDAKMRLLSYPRQVLGRSGLQVVLTGWGVAAESYLIDVTFNGLNIWLM